MIALVEGSERQRTPNEIALNVLLGALTVVFVVVCATLYPLADYSDAHQSVVVLTALLVCLIPTTIGALLSAIGIAGMDRLVRRNVLAMSGRAVEAAGDVDVLLLDKTGTITFGNRQASELLPCEGVTPGAPRRGRPARLAGGRDPGGPQHRGPGRRRAPAAYPTAPSLVPFTATTRMSGLDLPDLIVRKGAGSAVKKWVHSTGGAFSAELDALVDADRRRRAAPRSSSRSSAAASPLGCSASCTSRTSSRTASASGSPSCGRWASAP